MQVTSREPKSKQSQDVGWLGTCTCKAFEPGRKADGMHPAVSQLGSVLGLEKVAVDPRNWTRRRVTVNNLEREERGFGSGA